MNEAFRLSRIKAPRGTLTAILLLALFFIVFGLVLSGLVPDHAAAAEPRRFDTGLNLFTWLLER